MVRHASLFSQLVALFNRGQFHSLVFRHKAERYCKGFNSWDHFVAMLFYQLAHKLKAYARSAVDFPAAWENC